MVLLLGYKAATGGSFLFDCKEASHLRPAAHRLASASLYVDCRTDAFEGSGAPFMPTARQSILIEVATREPMRRQALARRIVRFRALKMVFPRNHRRSRLLTHGLERGATVMQDLAFRREKLLTDAADCELIATLAAEPQKRETFRRLAKDLKQLADDLGAEIARQEARNVA